VKVKNITLRKPWITKGLFESVTKKNLLHKRFLVNPTSYRDKTHNSSKNKLTHSLRVAKCLYYNKKLDEYKSNIRNNQVSVECYQAGRRHRLITVTETLIIRDSRSLIVLLNFDLKKALILVQSRHTKKTCRVLSVCNDTPLLPNRELDIVFKNHALRA